MNCEISKKNIFLRSYVGDFSKLYIVTITFRITITSILNSSEGMK